MNGNKLTWKQWLWEWWVITYSNHTIISIMCRDKKYSRKESDGVTEKYTTGERFVLFIFYATVLLCVNLAVSMAFAALNSDCGMSQTAFSNCFYAVSENSTRYNHCTHQNNTNIPKGEWIVPKSKPFTMGSKHYKFRMYPYLYADWYFTYDIPVNATSEEVTLFDKSQKSYVCVDAVNMVGQRLYCLRPDQVCQLNSNPPAKYNEKTLLKFIGLQVAESVLTQLAIFACVSPLSSLLMLLFVGICEGEHGSTWRKTYTGIRMLVVIFSFIFMIVWIFFALFFTCYFFTNMTTANLISALASSFGFWALQITIFDFLSACIGAPLTFPKLIFCCRPVEEYHPDNISNSIQVKGDKKV
jgi:hypothetical protein